MEGFKLINILINKASTSSNTLQFSSILEKEFFFYKRVVNITNIIVKIIDVMNSYKATF